MSPRGVPVPDEAQLELATRLREVRDYLGFSQQFVAESTGIPRSAISDIERGVRRVEALELRRLARLYRHPVGYFLGKDDGEDVTPTEVQALARAAQDLTPEDREELLRFANFLRQHGRTTPRNGGGG